MFERQARIPVDIRSLPPRRLYVDQLHESLNFSYACVRERIGQQLQKQKARYDMRTYGQSFKVGDMVWLYNPAVLRGRSKKLHRPWGGPYSVVARVSETVYRLQHLQRPRYTLIDSNAVLEIFDLHQRAYRRGVVGVLSSHTVL